MKKGKIIAIDYGLKRCGIAITDDLQMIASPLKTIEEHELFDFLKKQISTNSVIHLVLGYPKDLKGNSTDATNAVNVIFKKLKLQFPTIEITLFDERFTSLIAQRSIHEMQLPKNKREQKGLVDQISAAILLQDYLSTSNH